MLTQAIVRELLDYNPETGKLTWRERDRKWFSDDRDWRSWNARFSGKEAFSSRNAHGYLTGTIFSRKCLAHRIIWLWVHGCCPEEIDHESHVRSDNRLSNLRIIENSKSMVRAANNTSGITGVSFNKRLRKWKAFIGVGGRPLHLGFFFDKTSAIAARKAAEFRYGFDQSHGSSKLVDYPHSRMKRAA